MTYDIAIVLLQIDDKGKKLYFLKKTFLLGNISMHNLFAMPFFILNNLEINFNNELLG